MHSNEAKASVRNVALFGHSQRAWMSRDSVIVPPRLPLQVITHIGKLTSLLSRVDAITSCTGQDGGICVENGQLYYFRAVLDSSHSRGNAYRKPHKVRTGLLMRVGLLKGPFMST